MRSTDTRSYIVKIKQRIQHDISNCKYSSFDKLYNSYQRKIITEDLCIDVKMTT